MAVGVTRRLGVFGGTFDPVHLGHLHAARRARIALEIPNVTLLLAARPGHRAKPQASVGDRWRMLDVATRDCPDLLASDLEVVRPGPSYTVDTLLELREAEPLVWLIGRDALRDVPSWHRAGELPTLCNFLVLDRPGSGDPFVPPGFEWVDEIAGLAGHQTGRLYRLADSMPDVSASDVRRAVTGGGDAGALLPPGVWTYIRDRGLYGFRRNRSGPG